MSETRGQQWYLVMTHAHSENLAAKHLCRQGFETYLPLIEKQRRHARKTDLVTRPLFPRYLFVAFDQTRQCWRSVRSTIGVSHLVGNETGPSRVPPDVLDELHSRENNRGYFRFESRPPFRTGQQVQIINGAFSFCSALFEFMTDNDRVAVLLDLMGRHVRVFVDRGAVAAA